MMVKPVESYQYTFTAKHKYSKEISGPKLQVVHHLASTVQFHPENIDINLPGGIGDMRGSISEWTTWETKSGGEVLVVPPSLIRKARWNVPGIFLHIFDFGSPQQLQGGG